MKKINYYEPLYKNNLYHIYNRGNGKEKIFFNNGNYYYFLRQYDKYLSSILDTFAFCLLPNHFHLLIRIIIDDPEKISEQFRKLFISYTMSVNRQQKRKGNLFQRAFKRKLINDERYFYSAVFYIHSNPVHHLTTKDFTGYPFSSYQIFKSNQNTRLCKNEVFNWFGGKEQFFKYHNEYEGKLLNENYIIED